MALVNFSGVDKRFGVFDIIKGADWAVEEHRRIGLIGANGAGKTTLFRLITGEEEPSSGTVSRAKGLSIGLLQQHPQFGKDTTLLQEMMQAQPELLVMKQGLAEAEAEMADPAISADPAALQKVMDRYSRLQDSFSANDGYSYQSRVEEILHGMEFAKEDFQRPVNSFSGGEQTRLMLAKLLLLGPKLLLLDEPTNHLDTDTCEWLEGFLKDYQGTLVVISHDRYFLDRVVTEIVELKDTKLTAYPGNYSSYKELKGDEVEKALKDFEEQKAMIARTEDFIRRNIAGQNTKQAQGRRKMLEKLDRLERPQTREKRIALNFNFKGASGKAVAVAEHLSKCFGERQLFAPFDGAVHRGERMALIGPNGTGKTTLLKMLCGREKPTTGTFELGHGVVLGYYDQMQSSLEPKRSVLEEMWSLMPGAPQADVRGVLGRFLFSGDEVEKRVSSLSGGEKARLMLAKLVVEGPNFLVLDEPTNHLDIASREVVESALDEFEGTLLVVSHDRYFLDREMTHIWEIYQGRVVQHTGAYSEYLESRDKVRALAPAVPRPPVLRPAPSRVASAPKPPVVQARHGDEAKEHQRGLQQLKRRQEELEKSIAELELKKKALEDDFADPALAHDPEALKGLNQRYQQAKDGLDQAFSKWQELETRAEGFKLP
jgi:ATP-binding cassette subfamily F protein 3